MAKSNWNYEERARAKRNLIEKKKRKDELLTLLDALDRELGICVREGREAGIPVRDVAILAGMSPTTVQKWHKGPDPTLRP